MKMNAADMNTYKKFKYYVSVNIPEVARVGSIIQAIKKNSGDVESSTIKKALKWGQGPLIEIVPNLKNSAGNKIYGLFQGRIDPNKIKIHKTLVDHFQAGKGLVKTPNGKLVYIVGVTLLHELTHWADWLDGVDTDGEEGGHFETDVYGGVVFDPEFEKA